MSTIVIRYEGVDITADVILQTARFKSLTDARIGECELQVRDDKSGPYTNDYFKPGGEITLDINSKRVWGGYAEIITYEYPGSVWDTTVPDDVERFWLIRGVDYNILFQKRALYNLASPTKQMKVYEPDLGSVTDKQIIKDFVNLYLDLSGDGFDTGGQNAINLDQVTEEGEIYWQDDCAVTWQAASPGNSWGSGMKHVAEWSGAVFYIGPANPSQTHKGPTLYYHDVNTVTGPYQLNDHPASDPGSAGVQQLLHTEDISELATEGLIWGAGAGSTKMVFHRETATTQQSIYGTWQWSDFAAQVWKLECIKHRVKTYIHGSRANKRGHKKPRETWKATIFTPDFQPGDVVDMESYVHGIQDNVPIREMVITFINPTDAKFELTMSHHMDTAFVTSMWWDPDDLKDEPDGPDPNDPLGSKPFRETIPIGIGPIITPGPSEPDDSNLQLDPGPHFILHGAIRTTDNDIGTTERALAGEGPPIFPDWEFGNYIERLGNISWPDPRCCRSVGVGCWGGKIYATQFWYKAVPDMEGEPIRTLYILGQKLKREGTGGKVTISLVQDVNGENSAFEAWEDANVFPGIEGATFDGSGPIEDEDEPAYFHPYSGAWGSFISRPTLWIKSGPAENGSTFLVFTAWGDVAFGNETLPTQFIYCGDEVYADNQYVGLPAAAQGPAAEGFAGSGAIELKDLENTFYYKIEDNPYDGSANPVDGGSTTYTPGPEDKEYYTRFPYAPGSLEVFVAGIPLRAGQEFWELSPKDGHFKVHIAGTGIYTEGQFEVQYIISDPDGAINPGYTGFYDDYTDDSPHPADVPGGRVYRPRFQSQLGHKTAHDAYNCTAAGGAIFLDRQTMGGRVVTPPQIRTDTGISTIGDGISLQDIVDVVEDIYNEQVSNPGPLSWETFKKTVNGGRGALLTGNSVALVSWDLNARSEFTGEPFTGFHSLYVNEIRKSDGYLFCYDPAFRRNSKYDITPGWYPPGAIRQYAAYRTGSTNSIWAIYTQKTPRI